MPLRRQFLKEAAAAVVLTGCSFIEHAQRGRIRPSPREATVGGRRAKTIDIHAHVIIPEATAVMGLRTEPDNASVIAPDIRA